jgi:hypothetical protein
VTEEPYCGAGGGLDDSVTACSWVMQLGRGCSEENESTTQRVELCLTGRMRSMLGLRGDFLFSVESVKDRSPCGGVWQSKDVARKARTDWILNKSCALWYLPTLTRLRRLPGPW